MKLIIFYSLCCILYEAEAGVFKLQNHKTHIRCKKCPPGWGVLNKCNSTEDTVCVRCEHGKSYSPSFSSKSSCWSCSKCGIGLYEVNRCSPYRDTKCDECITIIGREKFDKKNDFDEKCSYLFLEHKSTNQYQS